MRGSSIVLFYCKKANDNIGFRVPLRAVLMGSQQEYIETRLRRCNTLKSAEHLFVFVRAAGSLGGSQK